MKINPTENLHAGFKVASTKIDVFFESILLSLSYHMRLVPVQVPSTAVIQSSSLDLGVTRYLSLSSSHQFRTFSKKKIAIPFFISARKLTDTSDQSTHITHYLRSSLLSHCFHNNHTMFSRIAPIVARTAAARSTFVAAPAAVRGFATVGEVATAADAAELSGYKNIPFRINQDAMVLEAVQQFAAHNIGCLVVTDDDGMYGYFIDLSSRKLVVGE